MSLVILLLVIFLIYTIFQINQNRNYLSYYKNIFEDNYSVIILADPKNGDIIDVNSAALSYYGYSKREILKKNLTDINTLSFQKLLAKIRKVEDEEKNHFYFKHRLANGDIRDVEVYASLIKTKSKKLLYSIIHDITQKKQVQEEINYLTFHDTTTGLYNRNYYEETIKKLDVESNYPLSLIMGDINGLKMTNDIFGHQMGDKLLIEVADILNKSTRSSDIVVRWGGDEFCIILPQTDDKGADHVVRRIKDLCQKSNLKPIPPSISLGISTKYEFEKGIKSIEDIFKVAGKKMYENKSQIKNSSDNFLLNALINKLSETDYQRISYIESMKDMAVRLGRKLNLCQNDLEKLSLLIEFYDIGILNLTEDIANKEEILTSKEQRKVKEHSILGYHISRNFTYLNSISEYILYHHENWDGSGYPEGLKGERIPLLSRIAHVLDIYYALTYKTAYILGSHYNCYDYQNDISKEFVLKEIKDKAGTFFDPKIIEAFITLFD
ncbi:sensor domain-containing diguanylate cyclase/phosphohydrolase [Orenia marismortui]|uniref:sensor domain-containing diguanylate cyclase/phosphohydrolase n=1 Tax=Orenia marismortui TaxID=46469 RepID=UPI0003704093|nr:diguanylate cyclase [Orenia marismortui]